MINIDYTKELSILIYDEFIDVMLKPADSDEYSDIITIWECNFKSILGLIPLNEDGMWEALGYHFNIDFAWEEGDDKPWEVDHLKTSLEQLIYVRKILFEGRETNEVSSLEYRICRDMCYIFNKAIKTNGKVYISRY